MTVKTEDKKSVKKEPLHDETHLAYEVHTLANIVYRHLAPVDPWQQASFPPAPAPTSQTWPGQDRQPLHFP